MNALSLVATYHRMKAIGLVANKREFALAWLGRGKTYIHDLIGDDRLHATVPTSVTSQLRGRLAVVAAHAPAGVAHDVMSIVGSIDQAVAVTTFGPWAAIITQLSDGAGARGHPPVLVRSDATSRWRPCPERTITHPLTSSACTSTSGRWQRSAEWPEKCCRPSG
ncbi:MAG: hypothetical protein K2X71_00435 [Methylobacterium sp.]|uniref:hypothetical protein n=1 Tax=Methylobacterium sp. TaxID=409 RepID=UPI00258BE277|nr:hypothetical protein [Methylobacterium sp.]MBY0294503.1 hypothetical protein [Methylobacterium sp.]